MLFEDITTGALVHGVLIDIENTTEEEITELNGLISQTPLTLFIPGDTVYVPYEEGYLESAVLGVIVTSACAYESPVEITNAHLTKAKNAFEQALKKASHLIQDPRIGRVLNTHPALYLSCCGPLPRTMLVCGERLQRDQRRQAHYRFYGHQDMNQSPMNGGVDGELIASAQYADIATVTLNETLINRWQDRVPKLSQPSIYLITSYD